MRSCYSVDIHGADIVFFLQHKKSNARMTYIDYESHDQQ